MHALPRQPRDNDVLIRAITILELWQSSHSFKQLRNTRVLYELKITVMGQRDLSFFGSPPSPRFQLHQMKPNGIFTMIYNMAQLVTLAVWHRSPFDDEGKSKVDQNGTDESWLLAGCTQTVQKRSTMHISQGHSSSDAKAAFSSEDGSKFLHAGVDLVRPFLIFCWVLIAKQTKQPEHKRQTTSARISPSDPNKENRKEYVKLGEYVWTNLG